MKRILMSAAALTALVAPTMAADMAPRPAPAPMYKAPPPVPVFSWTGCYGGVNAGYAWGKADVVSTISVAGINPNAVAAAESPSINLSGFTGGAQLGCNYQIGAIVWGIEGDFDYMGLRGSNTTTAIFPGGGGAFTVASSVNTTWLATVRPRVGVAFDRGLIYVTGGLAATNLQYNNTFTSVAGNFETASISTTRTGWTIGAGWEYAFDFNWSAKLEYLYTDFGHASTTGTEFFLGVLDGNTHTHDVRLRSSLLRVGLNYRFGGPVMAKY
jgi:outer membrane immunogenic protein